MTNLSPERKLRYLGEYISQLVGRRVAEHLGKINKFTSPEFKTPFSRWIESEIDKKKNQGRKNAINQRKRYCSYCGRPYDEYVEKTKDHVVPISRGGFDKKENRVHACFDCNQWKDDKTLDVWYKELKYLIKKDRILPPYDAKLVGRMMGNIQRIINEIKANAKSVSKYKI